MKKALLAILALGFITSASAYSWSDYTNGHSFLTWSGAWSSAFNSSARDNVAPTRPGWNPPPIPSSPARSWGLNPGFVVNKS